MKERADIFSDWEEALAEMRQTLDRIESRREVAVPDEEDSKPVEKPRG